MGPTWDPPGANRTQVGPMLSPWTLLSGILCGRNYLHVIFYQILFTVGDLRSTESARCTIMIRFVYEYATLYSQHAAPYVRMRHRIYEPKRVFRINYTIFPRCHEENSSFTTYLSKLIIHIVLLQPQNTMYLPGIEVSDDIVSLCGDGPAWKGPGEELLHHTAFLPSKTNLWEGKFFNTSGRSRYIYVLLLELSKFAIHLLKAMEHRFVYELFHGSACDTTGSAW